MIPLVVSDELRETILDYLETTFSFRDEDVAEALRRFLTDPKSGIFKGPYLNMKMPFRRGELTQAAQYLDVAPTFRPYQHQVNAFRRLTSKDGHLPEPTLITTGTGSGKTECFQFPILDHCLRNSHRRGIKAVILYPMNALAEDQAQRLAQEIWNRPELKGKVTAGVYIGGTGNKRTMGEKNIIDHKGTMRDYPPDILLTNYKMLDYLLIRPVDRKLWLPDETGTHPLQYLVLDELHTYDGAQGSDVACLLRRLRAKIGADANQICFVGTSATLANSTEGKRELLRFAKKICSAEVPLDAIIPEDRLKLEEFLPAASPQKTFPTPDESMTPQPGETAEIYLKREAERWFGAAVLANGEVDRQALGKAIKGHQFLKDVLKVVVLKEIPLSVDELLRLVQVTSDAFLAMLPQHREWTLRSFLALVSYARAVEEGREGPLLHAQVQLWLRALSQVAREVGPEPRFVWQEEGVSTPLLPGCFCRECGHSGWISVQLARDPSKYRVSSRDISARYFDNDKRVRYIFQADPSDEGVVWLTLPVGGDEAEVTAQRPDDPRAVAVYDADSTSYQTDQGKDKRRCPNCQSDHAMSWLGSAGASLSSVAVSHLYASPFNEDKKLLAFTDSVQDASHRAGFFMGRTYRFNLRTAIQSVLEQNGPTSLAKFYVEFQKYWIQRFIDEVTAEALRKSPKKKPDLLTTEIAAAQRFVATFLPPDLLGIKEYEDLIQRNKNHAKAVKATMERLRWEIAMEYGLNLRVGRTLDKVRCSTLWFDQEFLEDALSRIDSDLLERHAKWAEEDPIARLHFIKGVLMRAKRTGAVVESILDKYVTERGNRYQLNKKMNRLMSPFRSDSSAPRFLIDSARHPTWDCVRSEGSGVTWHADWAKRCLSGKLDRQSVNDLYGDLLVACEKAGVLKAEPTSDGKVYGLSPDAMTVTNHVALVRSSDGDDVTLPEWDADNWIGQPSLSYRGKGTYLADAGKRQSYYREVYTRGHVRRIHAHEHTGLLKRVERNKVEEGFREAPLADSPNLLACTPTLEMGIDVGDLSTTMVCSIPPTTSNYLQRIGRAGRKTGNALILAIANPQPHDLYYFAEPEKMLAGQIDPPGCFLDAPEMLKRQFVAFALDEWSKEVRAVLPTTLSAMLIKGSTFPSVFLTALEPRTDSMLEEFLDLFSGELNEDSLGRLRRWTGQNGVRESMESAIEVARADMHELRNTRERLDRKLKDLRADVTAKRISEEAFKQDFDEVRSEREHVQRRIQRLNRQDPLSFFVEKGVLPNYDLPEEGVTLRTIITDVYAGDQPPDPKKFVTNEIVRGAAPALREFAPFNSFYHGMRKFPIQLIETGGEKCSLIEAWRICDVCGHGELEISGDIVAQCPRCSSVSWPDSGRKMALLKHKRVESKVRDAESRNLDEKDDRDQERYDTKLFFGIPITGAKGGYVNEGALFGFEYLEAVTLREINFGTAGAGGTLTVAGQAVSNVGFRVCKDCGIVFGQNQLHRRSCRLQTKPDDEAYATLRLVREMESEAVRFLLPVSTLMSQMRLANLKAAIELGIRQKFGGKAAHLRLAPMTLPSATQDGGTRNYLVLYDSVVGGTGYLKEFVRKLSSMRQVFDRSLQALEDCSCKNEEGRDGCYRCIYAYQNQRERPLLSRRESIVLVQEVLAAWDGLQEVEGIGSYDVPDSYLESELERMLFDSLLKEADEKEFDPASPNGTRLRFGTHWWRVMLQQPLGPADGVEITCRPDMILYPNERSDSSVSPIAIFADGFQFHGCPHKPTSRLRDDLAKREGIVASGKYRVRVITKWDLEEAPNSTPRLGPLELNQAKWTQMASKLGFDGTRLAKGTLRSIVDDLRAGLDSSEIALSNLAYAAWVQTSGPTSPEDDAVCLASYLRGEAPGIVPGTGRYARAYSVSPHLLVYASLGVDGGLPTEVRASVWLSDDHDDRKELPYRGAWQDFWKLWNVCSENPNVRFRIGTEVNVEVDSSEASDLIDPSVAEILARAGLRGYGSPVVGYELVSADDEVIAMAELAWEDRKVAVFVDIDSPDVARFREAGWITMGPKDEVPGQEEKS